MDLLKTPEEIARMIAAAQMDRAPPPFGQRPTFPSSIDEAKRLSDIYTAIKLEAVERKGQVDPYHMLMAVTHAKEELDEVVMVNRSRIKAVT